MILDNAADIDCYSKTEDNATVSHALKFILFQDSISHKKLDFNYYLHIGIFGFKINLTCPRTSHQVATQKNFRGLGVYLGIKT